MARQPVKNNALPYPAPPLSSTHLEASGGHSPFLCLDLSSPELRGVQRASGPQGAARARGARLICVCLPSAQSVTLQA